MSIRAVVILLGLVIVLSAFGIVTAQYRTRSLFVEDVATQYDAFASYAVPELVGPVPLG